ncbi:MAG: hypothetical protein B7Y36_18840 [Novosphingobium sp. 28-62-57]|uniref:hypothetical protein n=1 Tax=Novosphingobium sp. 28-62-57 TaxID=1970409 RepID=UPI000BC52491|nr:hypothetical protein [Novosphingobium sp. 28-62-57]OYW50740.1 MAG: hypothetical protein B7Z34_02635 [Novosphingobium sp. 12-62-10]OYZ07775.1 MAG: hypothetical protein B7Y36_18840 [Novosphingobium sp. 28-62-57]
MSPEQQLAWLKQEADLERRLRQRRRHTEVLGAICWALFALIVFAGMAFETGRATGEAGHVARQLPGAFPGDGVQARGVEASHTAGPSLVGDQLHSKMEGNCR